MLQSGIREIHILLWKPAHLYFHNPGMFETAKQKALIEIASGRKISLDLEHEVFQMIDFGGEPCNKTLGYDKDLCTHQVLNSISLAKTGCTTPFGPDKENICVNREKGMEALEDYIKMFEDFSRTQNFCLSPCSYVTERIMKINDQFQPYVDSRKNSLVKIFTRENIKVTRASPLYTTLSLLAEIGGYVGLFLGVSFVQVNRIFDKVIKYTFKIE